MSLTKSMRTEEDRQFWSHVETVADHVRTSGDYTKHEMGRRLLEPSDSREESGRRNGTTGRFDSSARTHR